MAARHRPAPQTVRVPPPPGTPANTYRAAIDFCHSDLSDTGTANMIIVEFLGLDGLAGTQVVPGSGSCSAFGAPVSSDLQVEFKTYFDVRAVRISIVGDDAFFVDQVQLFKDGTRIAWDGRTNGGGWCISTDPGDYAPWSGTTSSCAANYTFQWPGELIGKADGQQFLSSGPQHSTKRPAMI